MSRGLLASPLRFFAGWATLAAATWLPHPVTAASPIELLRYRLPGDLSRFQATQCTIDVLPWNQLTSVSPSQAAAQRLASSIPQERRHEHNGHEHA